MCTIYGVCKIQPQLSITFNNIINKYADIFKGNKAVQHVYIEVSMGSESAEKKDIIHFYNEVFIKVMKIYIIALKPNSKPAGARNITKPTTPVQEFPFKPSVRALAP